MLRGSLPGWGWSVDLGLFVEVLVPHLSSSTDLPVDFNSFLYDRLDTLQVLGLEGLFLSSSVHRLVTLSCLHLFVVLGLGKCCVSSIEFMVARLLL